MTKRRRIKYYSPKRRALYAQGESIDALTVFERDNWLCIVCKAPIDKRKRCPDWYAATIDHIVPLSHGGKHIYENVAPAHLICNLRKGDTLLDPQAV